MSSRAREQLLLPRSREQITRHLQDVIGLCKCYGDFSRLSENEKKRLRCGETGPMIKGDCL